MNNDDLVDFLKSTLVKIENAVNLLSQDIPKHIPAYHKSLGIQQKFAGLDGELRGQFLPQIIAARSIINYLTNGRYKDALSRLQQLKGELIRFCSQLEKKNERDNIT